jgi:putative N6-adenine-specific DNA methylase
MIFIAKTLQGLEPVLVRELQNLGATNMRPLKRAVQYEGDHTLLYRSNLELRTALRILVQIATFRARHENHLYKKLREVAWSDYLDVENTFAVDAVVHSDYFNHSRYVALKTKDAIVDDFRERLGRRPSIDVQHPTVQFHLHIQDDVCTLLLDSSGESLHLRGYKTAAVEAPLSEVLAAGMIQLTDWQGDSDFLDPMCGSGTLPIEAARLACNFPSQWQRRHFGFMGWKDFKKTLWETVRAEAWARRKTFTHRIYGYDQDFKAVKAASFNCAAAEMETFVAIARHRFETLPPPSPAGLFIINPPYDERLQHEGLSDFYRAIGDHLKASYKGWTAWILSANLPALKQVGLHPSRKLTLFNGQLECRFQKFELFGGSRRDFLLTAASKDFPQS